MVFTQKQEIGITAFVVSWTRKTGNDQDATLLGLLIATYSPRAKFALNLAEAVFMYKAIQKDVSDGKEQELKEYLETFPGAEKRTAGDPRGFTNAHKVPNFTLNSDCS